MGNIFAVTTAIEDIKADAAGKASAIFTVTNTTNKPLRGIAQAKALGNTRQEWLDVEGEAERDFSAGGTQQFTVNFSKPAASASPPAETFLFRLDVASSANPDEYFTEGPTVKVAASTSAPVTAAKKAFPWWIVIVAIIVLLLVMAGILFLVLRGDKSPAVNSNANAAATPAATPTPTPTPTQPAATPTQPAIESTPAPKTVIDGARIRDERTGAIYLGLDGKLRHVQSGGTMNNLFKDGSVINIPNADEFPIGSPVTDGTYLAKTPSAPEIYLVIDGKKRWIPSQTIFDRYNFNMARVQMLSAQDIALIASGPDIP
ncbi:MAG TPA: hypothetical protein VGO50_05885 [Pyrinomonadaceae bacterium]|jgi:hypothetical protein|nr:hypothetical protein [Pyrinomonadaceae bacterium]